MTAATSRSAVDNAAPWQSVASAVVAGSVVVGGVCYALAATGSIRLTTPVAGSVVGAFLLYTSVVGAAVTNATRTAGPQRLTLATWLTLARGWLLVLFVGVAVGLAEPPVSWLVVGLFVGSAAGDVADGWVARHTDTVTALGARLDTETDALLVLVGAVAAVGIGTVPAVFLAVGLARYAFVAGVAIRRTRDKPVFDLQPSRFRQVTGAVIMATIAVALVPPIDPVISRAIAWVVTVPILVHFLWDWLAVSGRTSR